MSSQNSSTVEAYFSPQKGCLQNLSAFMLSAATSIHVAIYSINLQLIIADLITQKKKGLDVKVIADKSQYSDPKTGEAPFIKQLTDAGIPVKIFSPQKGIMHNKYTIIDSKEVETGSFNYTNHAEQANNENLVIIRLPAIAQVYENDFSSIWAQS